MAKNINYTHMFTRRTNTIAINCIPITHTHTYSVYTLAHTQHTRRQVPNKGWIVHWENKVYIISILPTRTQDMAAIRTMVI
jgi:hypothetical protein